MEEGADYNDGLRDGRLTSLENIARQQTNELHDMRKCFQEEFRQMRASQKIQERALWALGGAVAIIQFAPILKEFLGQ